MSKAVKVQKAVSKEKYFQAFLLGFLIMITALLPFLLSQNGLFIYYGDFNSQQIPFYNHANDFIRSGQTGWDWCTDLGSDFLTSYSFYLYASPFFRLTTLLPRNLVTLSIPILIAVKHGLTSLTAYIYIRKFVKTPNAAIIGGLLYSFSGFQLFNIFFNHFHDVTAFFPLMLFAMEENINNRKKGYFAVIVALMAVINYYFFAGQAVFLVLYYLFRMKSSDFNTSWKKFFGLVFEAVIGTAIAAAILVPSALLILGNYHVGEHSNGIDFLTYSDKTIIPRIIQTFFMPADPPARAILFERETNQWSSIGGYFPVFSMIGVISFIKIKRRHWASRLSLFCFLCMLVPMLNSAFQAMNNIYYARWFYMPLLIMAMMTSVIIDDEEADTRSGFIINGIMLAAFGLISLLPKLNKNNETVYFQLPRDKAYFWKQFTIAAICFAAAFHIFRNKKKGKKFIDTSLSLTLIGCIVCTFTLISYGSLTPDSATRYINNAINGKDNVVYEEIDKDNFFRVDMSENCDNYPMIWGLPSMRAFQSIVSPSIMEFYNTLELNRDVSSRIEPSHYTFRGLLSVKYFYKEVNDDCTYENLKNGTVVMPDDCEEYFKHNYLIVPDEIPGFEYVCQKGDFEIYENKLFVPMGIAYDSYIPFEEAEKLSPEIRERSMMKNLVFESSENEELYSDILEKTPSENCKTYSKEDYENFCIDKRENCASSFSFDDKGFNSEITLDKPEMVLFSVPYSEGWIAEVNGQPAKIEKVFSGLMAVKADKGDNTIIFRYETPGLKTGLIISGVGIVILALYLLICRKTKKDNDIYCHRHYYGYSSVSKIEAADEYCKSFIQKTNGGK